LARNLTLSSFQFFPSKVWSLVLLKSRSLKSKIWVKGGKFLLFFGLELLDSVFDLLLLLFHFKGTSLEQQIDVDLKLCLLIFFVSLVVEVLLDLEEFLFSVINLLLFLSCFFLLLGCFVYDLLE
jgi:hypothetical protein